MKCGRLLFLILILAVSWAAIMREIGYATSSQQTSAENSVRQNGDRSHDTREAGQLSPAGNGQSGLGPADNGSHEKEGSFSAEPQAHRPISAGNRSSGHARASGANRPKQLSNAQKHSPGRAPNFHSTRSGKFGRAANNGFVQNHAVNHEPQVRSTSIVRSAAASLNPSSNASLNPSPNLSPNLARHRGANPAVVSGTKNANSTGALNGTSMHRRP